MPFVKFQTSPKSNGNTGSCAQAINYFAKEDKDRDPAEPSHGFFTADGQNLSAESAQAFIEHDKYSQGLRKDESKFYHVMIAFSDKELQGKSDQDLIDFAKNNFAQTYLDAGQRDETNASELIWCAKLEHVRKYKGDDPKVQEKAKKSGQIKEGDNRHVHIVVARKTQNNRKISPLSNHFRKGTDKGAVKGGFDQAIFKTTLEMNFDDDFRHKRQKEDYVAEKLQAHRPDLFARQNSFDYFLGQAQDKIKKLSIPKAKEIKRFVLVIGDKLKERILSFSKRLIKEQSSEYKMEKLTPIIASFPEKSTLEEQAALIKKVEFAQQDYTRKRPGQKKPGTAIEKPIEKTIQREQKQAIKPTIEPPKPKRNNNFTM